MKLFHVSEEPDISRFSPRYSPRIDKSVVWAISENKLVNYMFPRDCPRIAYSAGKDTSKTDKKHFLACSQQVIAIEALWYERATTTMLYLYELPASAFNLFDSIAGYYTTERIVTPIHKHIINAPIKELLSKKIELRIMPCLWQLYDAVVNSTLEFSIIRMKNARPRMRSHY